MRSYSERHIFGAAALKAFRLAQIFVKQIVSREELRCHEIARAFSLVYHDEVEFEGIKLEVVDGHYGAVEHSWIQITSQSKILYHVDCILDTYVPGALPQVQLVSRVPGLAQNQIYRPGIKRQDIWAKNVWDLVGQWEQNKKRKQS